jgi:hypothetical protein
VADAERRQIRRTRERRAHDWRVSGPGCPPVVVRRPRVTDRQRGYAAAAGVTLLVVVTHASLLLGRVSPIWDALEFFGPYQMLIGDYLRGGRFLLWNPFTSFGAPDAIEPQLGAFSPIVALFGLVFGGSRHGFELYWLFAWLLGPFGVLRLARYLRTPAWGAYAVAAAWALSGFYTGHAEHTAWLACMSSLPWILWRLDVSVRDARPWPAVEAGAIWGLSALAGYPGIVLLNAGFAAVWAVGRSRRLMPFVKLMTLMGATGLLVLCPTYASFLVEGAGYSHRAGALPFDVAVESNALHPLALITLTAPGLSLANVYQYTDISMRSLYVGPVVLVLAAMALVARPQYFRWLLLAAGLLFLSAALGHSLPVRGWLYDLVPPTRFFRNAAMFRAYLMLSLILLALFGANDLGSMLVCGDRRLRTVFGVGAATAAAALGIYVAATSLVPGLTVGVRLPLQPLVAWGAVMGLCLTGALSFNLARTLIPVALVVVATLDAAASAYVMRPVMYGTAAAEWQDLDARRVADVDVTRRGLAREVDNGNNFTFAPKVPAASGYAPLTGPLVREYLAEPVLLDAAVGADRLWFSPSATEVDRSSRCLAAFRQTAARLGAPPLVIHRRDIMAAQGSDATGQCPANLTDLVPAERLHGAAVHIDRYTPDRLRMQVHVDQPGWLLVTDSWSRGWSGTVNGRPADVLGGNFLFRAVRVGAGTNTIDFSYRPFGYPWLLAVSWATLAVVSFVSVRRGSRPAA